MEFFTQIIEYITNNDIFSAIIAPWIFGDVIGVHSLGILSGSGKFSLAVAAIVPIISEVVVEIGGGLLLCKYRHTQWVEKMKERINNIKEYRVIERFDSLSIQKKFLCILTSRPLPGTRPFFVVLIATSNMKPKHFIPLFFLTTIIWHSFLVFTGFMIGKGIVSASWSEASLARITIGYIALLLCIFAVWHIVKKSKSKKKPISIPTITPNKQKEEIVE